MSYQISSSGNMFVVTNTDNWEVEKFSKNECWYTFNNIATPIKYSLYYKNPERPIILNAEYGEFQNEDGDPYQSDSLLQRDLDSFIGSFSGSAIIDPGNSSTETLEIGQGFVGETLRCLDYGIIYVSVYSNVASAIDGLQIQQSTNGVDWFFDDVFTIPAGKGKNFSINPHAEFFRIVYINGGTQQSIFILQTICKTNGKPSTHRIQDSIVDDDDAELVKSVLTGLSDIDANFENVKTYRGALQVDASLVHKIGISEHAKRDNGGATTLSVAASSGDTSITVADATGFAIDDLIRIFDSTVLERNHFHLINVVGSVLTLNRPLDNDFIIGDNVNEIEISMNQIGTLVSPLSFKVEPSLSERFQITRIIITMLDDSSMDDGRFGGIGALDNGTIIRTVTNGVTRTLTHWQSNGDLKDDMFDVNYADKAPAGQFGLNGRWTFTRAEFVVDLDGATGDYFEVLIQDDLSGLLDFEVKAQGRLFGG